jgi:hypothetical protein
MNKKSFLRTGHGAGAGMPRIEFVADELSPPVPAPQDTPSGVERRQDGTLASSEAAAALGRKGGRTKANRVALARSLAIGQFVDLEAFAPYRRAASTFRRHHCAALAKQAGGECGAAPSSMVASAALQLAASRFLFDMGARTGDAATLKTASGLANDSRQNLLAAYELAVREAAARQQATQTPSAALAAALGSEDA